MTNIKRVTFFLRHSVYISKMYILYEHIRVCCGRDVIVIYDVIGCKMETICSINANSHKIKHTGNCSLISMYVLDFMYFI